MRVLVIFLSFLLSGLAPAAAHVSASHGFSFASGLQHPVSGLDHVTAMIAVGVWAALAGGQRLWRWPLAFVGAMLAGGALAHEGIVVPYAEPAIVASIVILGIAIVLLAKLPTAAGAMLIACFGLAHGYAHGLETPPSGWAGYAAGFTLATALLHAFGICLGLAVLRYAGTIQARALGVLTVGVGLLVFYQ